MTRLFLFLCLVSAVIPLLPWDKAPAEVTAAFPGWPSTYQGRPVTRLPLTAREQRFGQGFPGRVARFSDGRRELVIRWVTAPSRKLHPAADCFRGLGYRITPRPLFRDAEGQVWGEAIAAKGAQRLRIRERLYDSRGGSWSDVSAWYWSALLDRTQGPWWAVTIAAYADQALP